MNSGPLCENFDRTLAGHGYYHGLLLREDVPYLLNQNGDFLVRVAQADKMATKLEMVLSVFYDPHSRPGKSGKEKENNIVHLVIQSTKKGKFYIDNGRTFNTVDELVHHFSENSFPVRNMNVRLGKGVPLASWEFQGKQIRIGDLLGGPGPVEVRKCVVKMDGSEKQAAGTLISGHSPNAWQSLKEMARQCRLLREFKHPCIVQFYGVCTLARPCCFLLEYVSEGKLNLYLIKHRGNLKRDELLRMTLCIGWGLDFLHSKGILHRDLAGKNCFYNKHLVKLCGFGLARKALVYSMKSLKKLSIRWMAPETVESFRFSQKSDVYSFGVLIYEIFSQCEPYEGHPSQDVKALIKKGKVNTFPAKTPKTLANFVKDSMWDRNPNNRLNMIKVMQFLTKYTGMKLEETTEGFSSLCFDSYDSRSAFLLFRNDPNEEGEKHSKMVTRNVLSLPSGRFSNGNVRLRAYSSSWHSPPPPLLSKGTVSQSSSAPAAKDVDFISPPGEDEGHGNVMEAVMIGGGKPKAAQSKERVKAASKPKVKPPKTKPVHVKKREPQKVAEADVAKKKKSAERVESAEGEPKRKSVESVVQAEAEQKGKSAESAQAEAEPKGKSAESVAPSKAEQKGQSAEGVADEKKATSPPRLEVSKKKPPTDVPGEKPPPQAAEPGALADIFNRAGNILFDFGNAMLYAFQENANHKPLSGSPQRQGVTSSSASSKASSKKAKEGQPQQ